MSQSPDPCRLEGSEQRSVEHNRVSSVTQVLQRSTTSAQNEQDGAATRHGSEFPTWVEAARIVFTFLPNSAISERVFALVKNMFGSDQLSMLGDCLQASLMLASNERQVG